MAALNINITKTDAGTDVSLHGSFAMSGISHLHQTLQGVLTDGASEITIHLDNIPMINSLFIGLLMTVCKTLAQRNGHLSISGLSHEQRLFFEDLHLHSCIILAPA